MVRRNGDRLARCGAGVRQPRSGLAHETRNPSWHSFGVDAKRMPNGWQRPQCGHGEPRAPLTTLPALPRGTVAAAQPGAVATDAAGAKPATGPVDTWSGAAMRARSGTAVRPGSGLVRLVGVAGLLVLAIVVARARASGASPRAVPPSDGLTLDVLRAIGIAVLTATLMLLMMGRRSRRTGSAPRPRLELTEAQRWQAVLAGLVGLLVATGYLLVAGVIGPEGERRSAGLEDAGPAGSASAQHQAGEHPPTVDGYPSWFGALVVVALLVGLGLVLARRAPDTEAAHPDADPEDTAQEQVARAVAAGWAAVRAGGLADPRQAIVACFAAMERALAELGEGLAPRAEDTPAEVLHRGEVAGVVPRRPADALLRLFHKARFSEHPMGEADRVAADRALSEILTVLRGPGERVR